jgi:hypothetical protein
MADAINRIIPPSVSLDRTGAANRDRERKQNGQERKKPAAEPTEPVPVKTPDDGATAGDSERGKHLDISA